ncbi:MAG: 16S rRNA (adenine(1518)-N(6)/adenine(1519)-N(6))-dimethyltransferase RsmA [Acidobacteriota bacterium]
MGRKFYAKKSLGQNFLEDQRYVDLIIEHVRPAAGETIVEIGPGRGAITEKLLESGAKVIAIELDRELAPMLRDKFAGDLTVFEADALTVDFRELPGVDDKPMRLVANLPYNISTAILQRLIEFRDRFSDMTLMFQLEVVDRITAAPGSSDRGFLTVLVESYLDSRKLFDIPPSAFRPAPKVNSAVVELKPKAGQGPPIPEFRKLVSAAFAQKRKTILNNLKPVRPESRELIEAAGIDPLRRAETLTLPEWLRLFEAFTPPL